MEPFDGYTEDDAVYDDNDAQEMGDFMLMLLDNEQNSDFVGDYEDMEDLDRLLASELSQAEQEEYARWLSEKLTREEADRAFAEALALQNSGDPVSKEDADLAYALSLERSAEDLAEKARIEADFAMALALAEERPAHTDDQSVALALQLADEEKERVEREQREAESDAEMARRLEAEWNAPPPKPVIVAPPIVVKPPHVHRIPRAAAGAGSTLSESHEGLLSDAAIKPFMETNVAALRMYIQSMNGCRVRRVLHPALSERFLALKMRYLKKYGDSPASQSTVCFHGTKGRHMTSIEQGGLKVPGKAAGVKHETDSGWWGKGIYVSPTATYAKTYSDNGALIVCAVLRGRPFTCKERMDGQPCKEGFDSHEAEAGQEYVLFRGDQVCPLFVVEPGFAKIPVVPNIPPTGGTWLNKNKKGQQPKKKWFGKKKK